MELTFDYSSIDDYRTFLRVKGLPAYRIEGRSAVVPDEYAHLLAGGESAAAVAGYTPPPFLFDYQAGVTALAVRKRKFAVFMACGLGKTLILLDYARHAAAVLPGRRVLIVSPLMVVPQTVGEASRFYGDALPVEQVGPKHLQRWLDGAGGGVGITNYEAIREGLRPGRLGALVLDESSLLKSHYGAWGRRLIGLGAGLGYKLCLTGTPAPNDRIEYANHAVILDQFPTVNAFLARYFVNRGQTDSRWELKPHALRPFYRSLSHWCVFVEHPATYGWRDNADAIPPVHVHIHDVDLTPEQAAAVSRVSGTLVGVPGGITSRGKLAQLAKGCVGGRPIPTNKPAFIRSLIDSWPGESTLVWCRYNHEQDLIERALPGAASIRGETPHADRQAIIAAFQRGETRVLVSKPKVLGFGLNLQVATRQVFNGLWDSYEETHQAIKRSNRIGSRVPLNVHIPITSVERAMVDTVLAKARRVQADTEEQERIFKGECVASYEEV